MFYFDNSGSFYSFADISSDLSSFLWKHYPGELQSTLFWSINAEILPDELLIKL